MDLTIVAVAACAALGALMPASLAAQQRRCRGTACDTTDSTSWVQLESQLSHLASTVEAAQAEEDALVQKMRYQTSAMYTDSAALRSQVSLNLQLRSVIRKLLNAQMELSMLCQSVSRSEGYIGISFDNASTSTMHSDGSYTYRFDTTPVITGVEQGSPAARGGVREGDELITINGMDITHSEMPLALTPGQKVIVRVRRNGEVQNINVVVGKRPDPIRASCRSRQLALAPMRTPAPDWPMTVVTPTMPRTPDVAVSVMAPPTVAAVAPTLAPPAPIGASGTTISIAGAELTKMSQELRDVFGVKTGLLVLDVAERSPAEEAGLKAGDVIVRAEGLACNSVWGLQSAIAGAADQHHVQLTVVRKKEERTLTLAWR